MVKICKSKGAIIMNKAYAFSEGKVKSNSISVIYVPKTNGCKDNIKWFDDNKLLRKINKIFQLIM